MVRAQGGGVGMRTSSFNTPNSVSRRRRKLIVLGQGCVSLSFTLEFRFPLLTACADLPHAARALSKRTPSSVPLQSNQMGSLTSQKKERQRWNCDN